MCHWYMEDDDHRLDSTIVGIQAGFFDPHERLTYSLKPHNMWSHPNNQPSTPQKTQKPVGFRKSTSRGTWELIGKIQAYLDKRWF